MNIKNKIYRYVLFSLFRKSALESKTKSDDANYFWETSLLRHFSTKTRQEKLKLDFTNHRTDPSVYWRWYPSYCTFFPNRNEQKQFVLPISSTPHGTHSIRQTSTKLLHPKRTINKEGGAQQKLSQPSPRRVTLLRFHYHKELEALKPPGCVKGDEYRPVRQEPSFSPTSPLLSNYFYGENG